MRKIFSSFILTVALAVSSISAMATELSSSELKAAQKVYLTKCAKCHKLYEPSSYSDEEWSTWMLKMKKKAKLKEEPYNLVSKYTDLLRKQAKETNASKSEKEKTK